MNRAQRLVVGVGVLALLVMCVYPPHVRSNPDSSWQGHGRWPGWAFGWLWEQGSIDTARLGLQCLLVAGVMGLLAYGLRSAAIQALAKKKKLAIQSAVALLIVMVVVVTVSTGLYVVRGGWEALHWWWDSLPAEQVSKISVVAPATVTMTPEEFFGESVPVSTPKVQAPAAKPKGDIFDQIEAEEKRTQPKPKFLSDEEVLGLPPVSTPKVQTPKAADPLDEILANPPDKWWLKDSLAPQQQRLVVKNGSGVALRAISIRIYYPGVPVPSAHDRVPCFSTPDGLTNVTVRMEHEYTLPLRAEVVGAWRQ